MKISLYSLRMDDKIECSRHSLHFLHLLRYFCPFPAMEIYYDIPSFSLSHIVYIFSLSVLYRYSRDYSQASCRRRSQFLGCVFVCFRQVSIVFSSMHYTVLVSFFSFLLLSPSPVLFKITPLYFWVTSMIFFLCLSIACVKYVAIEPLSALRHVVQSMQLDLWPRFQRSREYHSFSDRQQKAPVEMHGSKRFSASQQLFLSSFYSAPWLVLIYIHILESTYLFIFLLTNIFVSFCFACYCPLHIPLWAFP